MRDVNHMHTWYAGRTQPFADIKATGANTVRVVLSGGRWTADTAADVADVIARVRAPADDRRAELGPGLAVRHARQRADGARRRHLAQHRAVDPHVRGVQHGRVDPQLPRRL